MWTIKRGSQLTTWMMLAVAGCGSGLDLHPVQGKVEYDDGSPFTGGTVVCESIGMNPRRSANGTIHGDGCFELGTLRERDGLVTGKYRAAVLPPALSEAEASRQPSPIHPRFEDLTTSGLEFEVEPGENSILLTVSRPPSR